MVLEVRCILVEDMSYFRTKIWLNKNKHVFFFYIKIGFLYKYKMRRWKFVTLWINIPECFVRICSLFMHNNIKPRARKYMKVSFIKLLIIPLINLSADLILYKNKTYFHLKTIQFEKKWWIIFWCWQSDARRREGWSSIVVGF